MDWTIHRGSIRSTSHHVSRLCHRRCGHCRGDYNELLQGVLCRSTLEWYGSRVYPRWCPSVHLGVIVCQPCHKGTLLTCVRQPQIRGAMLAMYSVMYGIGGLGGSTALRIVSKMGPAKFRHAFYSQIVFLGLFFPIIPFLPETPCKGCDLVEKGQRADLQGTTLVNTKMTRPKRS